MKQEERLRIAIQTEMLCAKKSYTCVRVPPQDQQKSCLETCGFRVDRFQPTILDKVKLLLNKNEKAVTSSSLTLTIMQPSSEED